jgi:hypothetical protein
MKTIKPVTSMLLADFIDLHRYPINSLNSDEGKSLIAKCHDMMSRETICVLPGFLKSKAVSCLAEEISQLESEARKVDYQTTMYGWMDNAGYQPDHPRSILLRRRCSVLTTEQLAIDGLCKRLYQMDEITNFVRVLLGYDSLYCSACPTISVRLNIMHENDEFSWHFDTNDGVVSFTTQNADSGGIFEYAPLIRSEENENYDGVSQVLKGDRLPLQADTPAGSFVLFLGRRSLHQVSSVGPTKKSRQSLLFSYDRKPNMVFPEKIRERLTNPTSTPFRGL